jgi:voltage-gated potassium channel
MQWFMRRRFRVLLVAVVLLIAVYPHLRTLPGERLLLHILFTFVFVSGFLAVFPRHSARLVALLLAIPTLIGIWTGFVWPGDRQQAVTIGFHVLAALFLGFCTISIIREVYSDPAVSSDSVCGAFCGYLLIGLAFGHLYCVVELLTTGSFTGNEAFKTQVQSEEWRRFQLSYFSFITLTTVGYGDITPASDGAKGLALVEAITGQFYIAGLVAELIGKRVSQVLSGPPPESKQ